MKPAQQKIDILEYWLIHDQVKKGKKKLFSITFHPLVYAEKVGIELLGDWFVNDWLLVFLPFEET